MIRKTNTQRIEELETILKKPWYRTLEFWSIIISMVAILMASQYSHVANKIAVSNNKLEQASIRSAHISHTYQLINEVSEELKGSVNQSLSNVLIKKISSHTYILEPYHNGVLEIENDIMVSQGRGLLLNSILHFRIDSISQNRIFNESTFESSYLSSIIWDSINLINTRLANSYFISSKIKNVIILRTDFNGSSLLNAKFEFCKIKNQTTFNQCSMENGSFYHCLFEDNIEFIGCVFTNVNFKDTKFKNCVSSQLTSPFISCNLTGTTFENVNLFAKFQNCRWDGTTFINCMLANSFIDINQKDNFNMFEMSNLQGMRGGSACSPCFDYKIKLSNCILSHNNLLTKNEHFLKYHNLKDTMINNKQMVIANFKG